MTIVRPDGRQSDQLRSMRITPKYLPHAEGSALIELGNTTVLCAVSVEDRLVRREAVEQVGRPRLPASLADSLVDRVKWRDGTSMSPNLERQRFEELVLEAVEALPERFRARLVNVDIEVRDWPSPEELQSARVPAGRILLGLYVGIPYTSRGRYQVALPERIFIYQRPIERLCRSDDEVRERVKRVIKHEVAHHFGLTEADLHDTSVS